MKLFTTLLLSLFSLCAISQSYSFSQKTLITKRTATWCPNCGTWGWDFAKAIEELDNPNAVLIRAHYSGDLQSQVSIDITGNFNAVYQPEFYINEDRITVGSTTWQDKVEEFEEQIDENATLEANVSTSAYSYINNDEVTVTASSTFLKEAEGEFYLAAYLLENGVINNQASRGADAVHNRVLRASFTDSSFGNKIMSGTVEEGYYYAYSSDLKPGGEDLADRDFEILIVVWKKEEGVYKVENVHVSKIGETTDVQEMEAPISNINIYQVQEKLVIQFDQQENMNNSRIQLFSVGGQKIKDNVLNSKYGSNEHILDIGNLAKKQIYIVKIGDAFVTKMFVK